MKSDERLEYERQQREAAMKKVEDELKKVQQLIADGKIKKPELIGAHAQGILGRNHGKRYGSSTPMAASSTSSIRSIYPARRKLKVSIFSWRGR